MPAPEDDLDEEDERFYGWTDEYAETGYEHSWRFDKDREYTGEISIDDGATWLPAFLLPPAKYRGLRGRASGYPPEPILHKMLARIEARNS
jgi:hypothetical protein